MPRSARPSASGFSVATSCWWSARCPAWRATTRVLARARAGSEVVVVGQSLDDRDETLASLVTSFVFGGPIAVLLASLLGYLLAAAGLRPVEAMRRRAGEISLGNEQERLPLPPARDEVRRLGETLNEMLDRLRRSFERERRFVADASHELRTPVAVIKAELEGALRAGGHDPQVREALVAAVEECDGLAQLAEDLLVVARSGDGELPVRPESLPVDALLAGVGQRFEDRARERGRSIRVDAPGGPARRGRRAAHAPGPRQPRGQRPALRRGRDRAAVHATRSRASASRSRTRESGFGPDIAVRAFERFARGDGARTRGGAGLGLSIVRAIAEAHGGSAELVPGGAASVRIWLPEAPQRHLREGS